jgi:cysteine desulfurase
LTRAGLAERRALDLRQRVTSALDGVLFTGSPRNRLPGHLSLCVQGAEAEAILRDLDDFGIEASSGSACATEVGKPSHVLEAIGIEPAMTRGALTLMFGLGNTDGDAALASEGLERAVRRLRAIGPGHVDP